MVAHALTLNAYLARAALPALKRDIRENKLRGTPAPTTGLVTPPRDTSTYDRDRLLVIVDRDWLAGFTEAEGSFYILANGRYGFALGQA